MGVEGVQRGEGGVGGYLDGTGAGGEEEGCGGGVGRGGGGGENYLVGLGGLGEGGMGGVGWGAGGDEDGDESVILGGRLALCGCGTCSEGKSLKITKQKDEVGWNLREGANTLGAGMDNSWSIGGRWRVNNGFRSQMGINY